MPFEAVSARAVRVTALQVFETNIPQFLQVNTLGGTRELGRVGRVLWRKTIPLASPVPGRWTRYDLDVTELMRKHPGGLFQLTLSLTPADALYDCPGSSGETSSVDESELTQPGRASEAPIHRTRSTTARITSTATSSGTSATIPASRLTTATARTSAPSATCWPPTSA